MDEESERKIRFFRVRRLGSRIYEKHRQLLPSMAQELARRLRLESPQSTGQPQAVLQGAEELLVTLAGLLEGDGGMPGHTEELRVANSLAVALCFVQKGTTARTGPFRVHVDRLLSFLKSGALKALGRERVALVLSVLKQIEAGAVPKGDWQLHARRLAADGQVVLEVFWSDLARTISAATAPISR